jgi:hypothetical protein
MANVMRIGVIGYRAMGRGSALSLAKDPAWEVAADLRAARRELAAENHLAVSIIADAPPDLLRAVLVAGKQVWAANRWRRAQAHTSQPSHPSRPNSNPPWRPSCTVQLLPFAPCRC